MITEPYPHLIRPERPRWKVVRTSDGIVMGRSIRKIASDRLARFLGAGFRVERIKR